MNVLDFINSRDVRAHLEKIGWKPNSIETAWLIYQSKNHTLKEKLTAWQWVIDNMPDCEVPENYSGTYYESLRAFLERYIEFQQTETQAFKKCNTDEVYSYKYYGKGCISFISDNGLYSSYENALAAMRDEISEEYKPYAFRITKQVIDHPELDIHAELSPELEIREIVNITERVSDEYYEIVYSVFEGMWFDIPTPFERGDLVCACGGKYYVPSNHRQETFVLNSIITEDKELCAKRSHGWSNADMTAYGYFSDSDGGIYCECIHNYLNLEYIKSADLDPCDTILEPLSDFLKGKISVNALLAISDFERSKNRYKSLKKNLYP